MPNFFQLMPPISIIEKQMATTTMVFDRPCVKSTPAHTNMKMRL